jgi:hypothetical protein
MAAPVQEFEPAPGIRYLIHPHHRNGMADKAQWRIRVPQEVSVFATSLQRNWTDQGQGWGWGLYVVNGRAAYLGVGRDHVIRLFIAKFVDGTHANQWHGYPVDHRRGQSNCPTERVMNDWLQTEALPPAKISKIARGKPCRL